MKGSNSLRCQLEMKDKLIVSMEKQIKRLNAELGRLLEEKAQQSIRNKNLTEYIKIEAI